MRSSQSQRWIVTPNCCSAAAQLALAVVVLEVDPGDAGDREELGPTRRAACTRAGVRRSGAGCATTCRRTVRVRSRRAARATRATRSGSATRNDGRSGNASSDGRNHCGRLPAGIAWSKSCIVSRRSASRRLRADLGVGERAREQRHEARVALDHDVARGGDEVGIARREQDLVADALLAVTADTRASRRSGVQRGTSRPALARRAGRRGPRPIPTRRQPSTSSPAVSSAYAALPCRSRCSRARASIAVRKCSSDSSKRPTCAKHDAEVAVRGRRAVRRARSARSRHSIASARSPSIRWLLPSIVQRLTSVSQPRSMQRRSDAPRRCAAGRGC